MFDIPNVRALILLRGEFVVRVGWSWNKSGGRSEWGTERENYLHMQIGADANFRAYLPFSRRRWIN